MRRALITASIVAWWLPVAAAPAPVVLSSNMNYRGYMAVAGGPPGALVAWEQIALSGPDDRPREIRAALIGDTGKLVVAPVKLFDGGLGGNEMHAIWNGKTFTLAICNDAWDDAADREAHRKLVWGEVAANGTFIKRGEQNVPGRGSFFCSALHMEGDKIIIVATDKREQYGAHDNLLSRTCTSTRYDITGTRAIAGKPMQLCEVYAADAGWTIGRDAKDKDRIVTGTGKVLAPPLLYVGQPAAASLGGKLLVRLRSPRTAIVMGLLAPPFKKRTQLTLDKSPIDADGNTGVVALQGDRFALIQGAHQPRPHTNIAVFDLAGRATGAQEVGDDKHGFGLCAPLGTASLVCAGGGDDDVEAVVVPLP
jgi:hypothetical protein